MKFNKQNTKRYEKRLHSFIYKWKGNISQKKKKKVFHNNCNKYKINPQIKKRHSFNEIKSLKHACSKKTVIISFTFFLVVLLKH